MQQCQAGACSFSQAGGVGKNCRSISRIITLYKEAGLLLGQQICYAKSGTALSFNGTVYAKDRS